jgi:anti-anti-sigma factor
MLDISSEHQASSLIIRLNGRIDASSAKELEQHCTQVIETGERHLVFDFTNIDYISSAGLRVVLLVAKQLNAAGGSLKLCAMKEIILNVFEISGFSKLFNIFPTVDDAL